MGYALMLLLKLGWPVTAQTAAPQPLGVSLGSSERGPETQLFLPASQVMRMLLAGLRTTLPKYCTRHDQGSLRLGDTK